MGTIDMFRDEALRLAELSRYNVVMEQKEEVFCELAKLAMFISKAPIGGVSLVDEDHVWLKGRVGVELACLAREGAFCSHAVESNEDFFEVGDTLLDPRFVNNPLVTTAPHIRHYAAANLLGHRGYRLGTLWVMDTQPRTTDAAAREAMLSLGAQVVRLLELRYQNPVTRLANRSAFVNNLQCALNQQRGGSQLCRIASCSRKTPETPCLSARSTGELPCLVGYLQVRNLHLINSAYGYSVGEQVLQRIGEILRNWLGGHNLLGHMEGEHFAFAVLDETQGLAAEVFEARLAALRQLLDKPLLIDGTVVHVATSLGQAIFPKAGTNAASLVDQAAADAFMRGGPLPEARGGSQFAMKAMAEVVNLQKTLSDDIGEDRLAAFYQPEVDLRSGRIVGLEALARLRHAQAGLVDPKKFVPMAEQSGLVGRVDRQMFEALCADVARWRAAGLEVLPVSFNLSPVSLGDPGLATDLRAILERYEVDPRGLAIELAESVFAAPSATQAAILAELRTLGLKVTIDDFGSRLTNIGRLKGVSFDRLKTDRQFTRNAASNIYVGGIMRFVKGIADTLGVELVCKGVEEQSDLAWLGELGCDTVQGWYFSRAVEAEAVPGLLRRLDEFHAGGGWRGRSHPALAACLQA